MPPTSHYIYSWSDTIPAPKSTAGLPSATEGSAPNDVVTQHLQQQTLNQSLLNDKLGSILNTQQSLQRETISMMNEMLKRHENKQFIHDIQMFNGKKKQILMSGLLK